MAMQNLPRQDILYVQSLFCKITMMTLTGMQSNDAACGFAYHAGQRTGETDRESVTCAFACPVIQTNVVTQ